MLTNYLALELKISLEFDCYRHPCYLKHFYNVNANHKKLSWESTKEMTINHKERLILR